MMDTDSKVTSFSPIDRELMQMLPLDFVLIIYSRSSEGSNETDLYEEQLQVVFISCFQMTVVLCSLRQCQDEDYLIDVCFCRFLPKRGILFHLSCGS